MGLFSRLPSSLLALLSCVLLCVVTHNSSAGLVSHNFYAPGTNEADNDLHDDHLHEGEFVTGPTTPGKWGLPTHGSSCGVVTWSIATANYPSEVDFVPIVPLSTFMPAGFKAQIERAFDAWSSVADITFVEVADSNAPFNSAAGAEGDIRIGGRVFDGPSGTLARAFFPPVNGTTAAGDIHFDVAEDWKIGFGGPGFDIFQVAAHEIGHSIGLDHTPAADALMNAIYTESFEGPQHDDIAGAISLCGAAAVPEPSPILLLLTTIVGLSMFKWLRRS